MNMGTNDKISVDLVTRLPSEWHSSVFSDIKEMISLTNHKVVVLDDDPTGTQTVHNVPILTEWSTPSLEKEFQNNSVGFYILTNTRSFNPDEAREINHQIGFNLTKTAKKCKKAFHLISRGDSTLRGHFPSEVEALADSTGINYDAWILLPAFIEGGRVTVNDIHYVYEGGKYIPAGLTQFAKDTVFGYKSSNLNEWIIEKFCGNISPKSIHSISINNIRKGGPKSVCQKLSKLNNGQICIVNAVTYSDIEVFSLGMLMA